MEQLTIDGVVDRLKKLPRKELLEYKFLDFLNFCQGAFLGVEAQERLEEFKRAMPDERDLHTALLLLAYIYRETPYIEERVTPPRSIEEPGKQPLSPAEPESFNFPANLKNSPTMREIEYPSYIKKADDYMLRIANTTQWESQRLKPKKDDFFFESLYRKEKREQCNILREITLQISDEEKRRNAMRRKYYRWKKKKEESRTTSRSWPSKEFFRFVVFCSFKFIEIDHNQYNFPNGNEKEVFSYAFGEGPDIRTLRLLRLMIPQVSAQTDEDGLKLEHAKASKMEPVSVRDKAMKALAAKDCRKAIESLCQASDKYRPRYSMQGALLGIDQFIIERQWKASGFEGLALTCTAKELKIRQTILQIPLAALPIGCVVHSISIEVEQAGIVFFKDLVKAEIEESDWLHFSRPQKNYKKIVFPATLKNFDLLMKNIDHISGSNVRFCFASGNKVASRRLSGNFNIIPLKK